LERKMKKTKSAKSNSRGGKMSKKRSKKKRPKSYKKPHSQRPTMLPTTSSNNNETDFRLYYATGKNHETDKNNTLTPTTSLEYTNIILESGSHLTVGSGMSIEAKGMMYGRDSTIFVSESSLKVQGSEIAVIGSSYIHRDDANDYGVGGHAIAFFEGSKGHIECDASIFQPPPGTYCEVGPTILPTCGNGEFCQLDPGVCNNKSAIQRGTCSKIPSIACMEIWQPVCGCDGNTYGNECKARASGVSASREGECGRGSGAQPCLEENQCRNPLDDTCGFVNRCVADPCSTPMACESGEECTANYCGGCHAICSSPIIAKNIPSEPTGATTSDARASCDDDSIRIIGGEGDQEKEGGNGRGGIALQVYGQDTKVQINGATLIGGDGSINGRSSEIAEAEVTIHSAFMDGEILVAKRGKLHVHGGTFANHIEVLGDTSSVTFYGCFDRLTERQDENFAEWTFGFSGMDESINVIVHTGGDIAWKETGQCDESSASDIFTR